MKDNKVENNSTEELIEELELEESNKGKKLNKKVLTFLFIIVILVLSIYAFLNIYYKPKCTKKNPLTLNTYKKLLLNDNSNSNNIKSMKNKKINLSNKKVVSVKRSSNKKLNREIEFLVKEVKNIEDKINILEKLISNNKDKAISLLEDIKVLDSKYDKIEKRLNNLDNNLNVLTLKLDDLLNKVQFIKDKLYLIENYKKKELKKLELLRKIGTIMKDNKKYIIYKDKFNRIIMKESGE